MPYERPPWTAIVLAGQRPGGDPLAIHFAVALKAMIPVAGRPMLARVVAALELTPVIGAIVVLGQDARVMDALDHGRAAFVPSGDGIAASIAAVIGSAQAPWPVLVTTADHPLLTPEIITAFIHASGDCDLSVGMVERATLIARYPANRRTWLKFRDGQWSGANLFALTGPAAMPALTLWARVERDRKSPLRLIIRLVMRAGPWLTLRAVTRTITLGAAIAGVGRSLGFTAKLVDLPFAEAAIDVDKPSDHALAEAILASR